MQNVTQGMVPTQAIIQMLENQYRASLNMLRQALEKVPPAQWNDDLYHNPNWQIIYHVLWGTHFYLSAGPEHYVPWPNAIPGAESLGGAAEWENPGVAVQGVHSPQELLAFMDDIEAQLPTALAALDMQQDSGFEWYPFSRLELHINSIRHIQHHTAQVIERLKAQGISGFPWAIDGNAPQEW
jgi:hypothetical protein